MFNYKNVMLDFRGMIDEGSGGDREQFFDFEKRKIVCSWKIAIIIIIIPSPPKRALNSVTLRTSSASVRGVRPRKQGLNFDRFDGVEVRNFFSGAFAPSSLLFSK